MYTSDRTVFYLMSLLNSILHHCTSWQPGGLVELQTVQELLPNHFHSFSEAVLFRTCVHIHANTFMKAGI